MFSRGYCIRSVQVNGCSQLGLDPLGQHGGDTSGCEDSLFFILVALHPLFRFTVAVGGVG